MDLAKFVSFLQSQSLYFSRADLLGDPFEGTVTRAVIEALQAQSEDFGSTNGAKPLIDQMRTSYQSTKRNTYVNCWHMSDHESAAMWKIYSLANQGICITASYDFLDQSLSEDVFLGQVKYIDYDSDAFRVDNALWPFVHKRKSFVFESEVRAVIWNQGADSKFRFAADPRPSGILEKVDFNVIDKVYLHPDSQNWYAELIRSLLETYSLKADLVRSKLSEVPFW